MVTEYTPDKTIEQSELISLLDKIWRDKRISPEESQVLSSVRKANIGGPQGNLFYDDLLDILADYCPNLTTLTLKNAGVTCIAPLKKLKSLKYLNLHDNNVCDITPLQNLSQLETLWLSKTSVSDITPLQNLSQLETLYLYNTPVSDITPLQNLPQLKRLYLSFMSISDITPLQNLSQLQRLDLEKTSVSDITPLQNLSQLQALWLTDTSVSDITPLQNLSQLEKLWLSKTSVSDITPLQNLSQLQTLYLNNTSISDITPLQNLSQLQRLDLENTSVSDITPLQNLSQLQRLDLENTSVSDITPLHNLTNLSRLSLNGLVLDDLPDWLPSLGLTFSRERLSDGITLVYTTVNTIDDMSIFDQPQEIILQWFEERQKGNVRPLNEIKVVFLGNAEAGKSFTIKRLMNNGVCPEKVELDTTPGIAFEHKTYDIDGRSVKVHFWDFGGQDILYSTHRMFLTDRTLYVLMINGRDDTLNERARDWLYNLRSYTHNAPVIVVTNKIDQNPNASLNETDLRAIYPNIRRFLRLSALKFTTEEFNSTFTETLLDEIRACELLDALFPNSWFKLKSALEEMEQPYISYSDYLNLCHDCGIEKNQGDLLNYYHDLGISFRYQGSPRIEDCMVLNPQWITNAIYIIIFNKHSKGTNGMIPHKDIETMLTKTDGRESIKCVYPDKTYAWSEIDYVLRVIRKFRLSFHVDDSYEFFPQLCGSNTLPVAEEYMCARDTPELGMEFDYLSELVIQRLMVDFRNELDITQVWKTGALFRKHGDDPSAVVKLEGTRLRIFVRSNNHLFPAHAYLCDLKDAVTRITEELNLSIKKSYVVDKTDGGHEEFSYQALIGQYHYDQKSKIYSTVRDRMIPISDILCQTDSTEVELRKELWNKLISACEALQNDVHYRNVSENTRNDGLRNLLRSAGYIVADQSRGGISATGIGAGERDLALFKDAARQLTIIEGLNLSGAEITDWQGHLKKLLDNYNANGLPFLFLVSYLTCTKEKYAGIITKFSDEIKRYEPYPFTILYEPKPKEIRNNLISAFESTYDCGGNPTTVYHIFVQFAP